MNRQAKGALLSTLGGICWGLSGSVGQYLFDVEGMDARYLTPIRLGGAGILLLVYCMIRYGASFVFAPWKGRRDRRDLLIYGLLGVSACQFLYFRTIQLSSAAVATILQDLSPAIILLVTCALARRAPKKVEIAAIVLGLAGVFLITTGGNLSGFSVPAAALVSGVLCAFTVMIYNVVPANLFKSYPVVLLQGWAFFMGSIVLGLIFRPWSYHYTPTLIGYLGIAFVILVGNMLAFPLYMEGVHLIGPEKGILYGFSEPLTAAIIGVLFLHNTFTFWDGVGFVLVFGMLSLISRPKKKKKAVQAKTAQAA